MLNKGRSLILVISLLLPLTTSSQTPLPPPEKATPSIPRADDPMGRHTPYGTVKDFVEAVGRPITLWPPIS